MVSWKFDRIENILRDRSVLLILHNQIDMAERVQQSPVIILELIGDYCGCVLKSAIKYHPGISELDKNRSTIKICHPNLEGFEYGLKTYSNSSIKWKCAYSERLSKKDYCNVQ